MTTRLGRTLRTIRTDRGMTMYRVAKVTGIDVSLFSRLESGERTSVSIETLRRYVERMDLKHKELVELGLAAIQPNGRTIGTMRRNEP